MRNESARKHGAGDGWRLRDRARDRTGVFHHLLGTRVGVFEVMPPAVDTEVGKDIGGRMLSPSAVAKAVVAGVKRETHEIRMGPSKALYAVHRISPGLAERLLRRATSVPTRTGAERT